MEFQFGEWNITYYVFNENFGKIPYKPKFTMKYENFVQSTNFQKTKFPDNVQMLKHALCLKNMEQMKKKWYQQNCFIFRFHNSMGKFG